MLSAAATTNAARATVDAEHRIAQLARQRGALQRRYEEEVAAIDRLKKQRASWRRDRELRDSLSTSLETSKQLEAATRELDKAQRRLAGARREYLAEIEAELQSRPVPSRAQQLERLRATLASQVKDTPRRIVIPDLEIDPLADPEELLLRATELRASEDELSRQLAGLAAQATELDHAAQLRKQHTRAADLVNRYDDQPHRSTARSADSNSDPGPGEAPVEPSHLPSPPPTAPSFDNYVPTVLADVIDASTINTFTAAQLSKDPAQRAAATRKAHDAVSKRLEQVRRKRAELEMRAKLLQSKR